MRNAAAVTVSTLFIAGALALSGCAAKSATSAANGVRATTTARAVAPAPTMSAMTPSPTSASAGDDNAASRATAGPAHVTPTVGPANTTTVITVRPVTTDGRPAPGYHVAPGDYPDALSCPALPSPASTSPGIYWCQPSAAYAIACWVDGTATADHTMLCLRDPLSRQLVRLRYGGNLAAVGAAVTPAPMALVLADGTACQLRDGGAWAQPTGRPDLFGRYFCGATVVVWGPRDGDGITHTATGWTVLTGDPAGTGVVRTQPVAKAIYVGSLPSRG